MSTELIQIEDYLLLIDKEAEIKEGDIVYRDTGVVFKITNERISYYKEIIPETVHKIYKCIAYYPLTKNAQEFNLPLLPKPSEKYLEAKWVIENPDGYDKRDVARANSYCEAYLEGYNQILHLSIVNYQLPHYFNAPDEDKSSRFCKCGKYLTDEIHLRQL